MGERVETFPYEVLLIWQGLYGPLNDEQASRFVNSADVQRLGVFRNSVVSVALQQTPRLSEALVIAQSSQANRQPSATKKRLTSHHHQEHLNANRQPKVEARMSANRRWRKGGFSVRRAQIWADENRDNPTEAEKQLEVILRRVFPRSGALQVQWIFGKPSSPYILDFYIPEVRLGIEVDGSIHDIPLVKARDEDKEQMARSIDITVRRFTNDEVLTNNPEAISKTVQSWYREASQHGLSRRRRPR